MTLSQTKGRTLRTFTVRTDAGKKSTIFIQLTSPTEQTPSSAANRSSASQEVIRILSHPKVHHRIHNSRPPVTVLSNINPVHALPSPFSEIHFNIELPSKPTSSKWTTSLRFHNQNPVSTSSVSHTRHMPCSSHSSWFYHTNKIRRAIKIIKFLAMYFSPFLCSVARLRPNKHPILEHPHPAFLPQCERLSFTSMQNNRQNYSSVYLKLHIFWIANCKTKYSALITSTQAIYWNATKRYGIRRLFV